MKMKHINLPVANIKSSREFFEGRFDLKCIVEKGEDTFAGLIDDGGMVLTINHFGGVDHVEYPKWFYVGVIQEADAKVDEIFSRLKSEGVDVKERKNMHGAWTFYFDGSGGYTIEVSHQHDQNIA